MAGGNCVPEQHVEPVSSMRTEFLDIGILLGYRHPGELSVTGTDLAHDTYDRIVRGGIAAYVVLISGSREFVPQFLLPGQFLPGIHQIRVPGRLGLHCH